jgi:multidrug efflux pump subunit AcrA (membrane-fusion protein)
MIALPRQAIVPQGQLTTTWVVVNARARRRIIAVGEATGADAVEVVAGLAVGEQVILMPPPQLRDGDPVAVTGGR